MNSPMDSTPVDSARHDDIWSGAPSAGPLHSTRVVPSGSASTHPNVPSSGADPSVADIRRPSVSHCLLIQYTAASWTKSSPCTSIKRVRPIRPCEVHSLCEADFLTEKNALTY